MPIAVQPADSDRAILIRLVEAFNSMEGTMSTEIENLTRAIRNELVDAIRGATDAMEARVLAAQGDRDRVQAELTAFKSEVQQVTADVEAPGVYGDEGEPAPTEPAPPEPTPEQPTEPAPAEPEQPQG